MDDPVRIPQELFRRMIEVIENPGTWTWQERTELLEEADHHYPYSDKDDPDADEVR